MILTGLTICASVALLLVKLPRCWSLRALKHDLVIDASVSAAMLALHYGTFSGLIAATFAGLLMSLFTSSMKRLVGYIDGDFYHPGLIALKL